MNRLAEAGAGEGEGELEEVVDGSKIKQLVENNETYGNYVEEKFRELDKDNSGRLTPKELSPAVATIGSAMGLPSPGSSPDSDNIYSQVLDEFVQGKRDGINKEEYGAVLSDFLLGVADGLERDPVTLLTLDGQHLQNYVLAPLFEVDAVAIFSQLQSTQPSIKKALTKIAIEQGMPPANDPWVMKNIVEAALTSCSIKPKRGMTQTEFVEALRRVLLEVASRLKRRHLTVAHTSKTYDGKSIEQFLNKKDDLGKTLEMTWKALPKDRHGNMPREYLRVGLDMLAPATGLPPWGAVEEMDKVISEIFKMVKVDEGGVLNKKEFSKLMLLIVGSLMLQLQGDSISVSSNTVIKDKSPKSDLLPSRSIQ